MRIAILGMPASGKTTLFNALTGRQAPVATYGAAGLEPNLATVSVPDPRLEALAELYRPRKVTPVQVEYVDIGGLGTGKEEAYRGLPPRLLNYLAGVDALILVVRAFRDEAVPHPRGKVDPLGDLEELRLELQLADLGTVERRMARIEREAAKMRGPEREARQREAEVLERVRAALEEGRPVRDLELRPEELRLLRGFNLLTLLPEIVVFNVGEGEEGAELVEAGRVPFRRSAALALCAQLEMEVAQLPPEEQAAFLEELGIRIPAARRLIQVSFETLGWIRFYTVSEEEVRAWALREGGTALEAAATIHTDLARGFIRAEVIAADRLLEAGSWAEARRRGWIRLEGKEYVVQDGEICHILFNL